jgi:hypothetical protein
MTVRFVYNNKKLNPETAKNAKKKAKNAKILI